MYTSSSGAFPGLVTLLALYLLIATAMGDWVYSYCSKQNTASDVSPFYWPWQSNGKCHDHCAEQGTYAFAVIQQTNCWCSNYIPQEQDDISDCSDFCPGFDEEKCGKKGKNYIYLQLDGTPSGTAGASQPSSTKVGPSSSGAPSQSPPEASTPAPAPPSTSASIETNPDPSTVIKTVTSAEVITLSLSQNDRPSSTLRTTTSPTEDPPSSVAPAKTSLITVTEGGAAVTKTLVTNPSTNTPQPETNNNNSKPIGAIVGGTLGGIGLLAVIIAGVLFMLWRRRKQRRSEEGDESGVPQRHVSTMSKAGLLRTEKGPQFPSSIATTFNKRHSRTMDQDSISPISASDRRNSSYRVDQRLNPSTLFVFDNSSRGTVGSLDDSRDYHRTLNVRNPDAQ